MFTGAGAPAGGGATGAQQIAGGCSSGLLMLCAFGMYSGWCADEPSAPAVPVAARNATASRLAVTQTVLMIRLVI